jgi:hypothetical protein
VPVEQSSANRLVMQHSHRSGKHQLCAPVPTSTQHWAYVLPFGNAICKIHLLQNSPCQLSALQRLLVKHIESTCKCSSSFKSNKLSQQDCLGDLKAVLTAQGKLQLVKPHDKTLTCYVLVHICTLDFEKWVPLPCRKRALHERFQPVTITSEKGGLKNRTHHNKC